MIKTFRVLPAFLTGLLFLSIGTAFYFLLRQNPFSISGIYPSVSLPGGFSYFLGSFPSFFHTLGFCFLTFSISRRSLLNVYLTGFFWVLFSAGYEFSQYLGIINGTGDLFDVLFSSAASLVFIVIANFISELKSDLPGPVFLNRKTMVFFRIALFFPAVLSALASDPPPPCPPEADCEQQIYAPVYMSYDELRSAVKAEDTKKLTESGKILISGNRLFVSDRNRGVQIYDITDKASPTALVYINIPGNLDLNISGDILYADSFIDLLAIDVSTPTKEGITLKSRTKDVFPYDPYQMIDDSSIKFSVDSSKGVVVGYKNAADKVEWE